MSRSPIVHCHFMLHFYERINDDDDDDDDDDEKYATVAPVNRYLSNLQI